MVLVPVPPSIFAPMVFEVILMLSLPDPPINCVGVANPADHPFKVIVLLPLVPDASTLAKFVAPEYHHSKKLASGNGHRRRGS
jgi:hypothetical protein